MEPSFFHSPLLLIYLSMRETNTSQLSRFGIDYSEESFNCLIEVLESFWKRDQRAIPHFFLC
jgi:hypothetical protein